MSFYLLIQVITGAFLGILGTWFYYRKKTGDLKNLAQEILQTAEREAETLRRESEHAIREAELSHEKELKEQLSSFQKSLKREEERLQKRKQNLEKSLSELESKKAEIKIKESEINQNAKKLKEKENFTEKLKDKFLNKIENLSSLNRESAKKILLDNVSKQIQQDAARITVETIENAKEDAEQQAKNIIATAVNRLAISQASETTACTLNLPNEEIKSRIIGREGRNIRSLEQATGVNFILDETPETVTISGFDPLRKQIAKVALKELVLDGRIHPSRIEEAVKSAKESVNRQIILTGREAAQRCGCIDLDKNIINLLGKLSLRRSFGQNLLEHSIEVSYLLGLMADELGLNSQLAKRIGLLHDIGKAASQEMDGSHALVGMALATKYGESREVANGIGCHHNEVKPTTVEASLCGAADTLSAARPGARIEAVGEYIKRLKKLEELAFEFPAVEYAYALQAGRELRVTVLPDMIDDPGAINLARDLTHAIQQRIRYSGKIKVTIIREKRVVDYAL